MSATCAFPGGCTKPVLARGFCGTHYTRLRKHGDVMTVLPKGGHGRPRPPKPPEEQVPVNSRFVFQPKHWHAWLAAREPDAHSQKLAAGIAEMRSLLVRPNEVLSVRRRA